MYKRLFEEEQKQHSSFTQSTDTAPGFNLSLLLHLTQNLLGQETPISFLFLAKILFLVTSTIYEELTLGDRGS